MSERRYELEARAGFTGRSRGAFAALDLQAVIGMLGLKRARSVEAHEAEGETERIYHEIGQVLRVTGVDLLFRVLATHERYLSAMWQEVRPNAETRRFEDAADLLRAKSIELASGMPRVDATSRAPLGESQRFHVQAAHALYQYLQPKALLVTSILRIAIEGDGLERATRSSGEDGRGDGQRRTEGDGWPRPEARPRDGIDLIERGPPLSMPPMEMIVDPPEERGLRELFDEVKRVLAMDPIDSPYRTFALWPAYLRAAWEGLRRVVEAEDFRKAADALKDVARAQARGLVFPTTLTRERIRKIGDDPEEIGRLLARFDRTLPAACIAGTLLALDFRSADALAHSPFPAGSRAGWSTERKVAS